MKRLIIILYLTSQMAVRVIADCIFPQFLQNDPLDQTDIWYTNEMKGTSYHSVVFNQDSMVAIAKEFTNQTSFGYKLTSFNRTCVEKIGENNYLVSQKSIDPKEPVFYVCMQFLLRNQGVAQIRSGEMDVKPRAELCDDSKMKLNDWPLLRASFRRYRVPCPSELIGSYYFYLYDPRAQQTNCQGYWLRPRLQIGCMEDEGLKFRFPPCAGYPLTKVEDLQCFATWNDKGYTYLIAARVDADQESPPWTEWCLRFPRDRGNSSSITAYIFQDMKCESADIPDPLEIRHARLTMWPAEYGFCSDETDTCEALKPLGYCSMSHQRMNCLKTCGICQENETFEPPCTFPRSLRGSWLIPGTDKRITIDKTSFRHPEFASGFKCVSKSITRGRPFSTPKRLNFKTLTQNDQNNSSISLTDLESSESELLTYVVYSESTRNGELSCKPRFTCLQFLQGEPNKFSFRLSLSSDKIPIVEESLCGETRFIDDYPPYSNRYRNRDMKLAMASTGVHVPVKCKLDARINLVLTSLSEENPSTCNYTLSDCKDPTMINLESNSSCQRSALVGSHACLFSNDLEPDLYRIILTQNTQGNIFCWYIETLEKETNNFRVIVTSNKECSRHSYGLFLKFPQNMEPYFIFSFKNSPDVSNDLMGCNVNIASVTKDTSSETPKPIKVDETRAFTISDLKESLAGRTNGAATIFNPMEISVNAAQSGKSPFRQAKISDITELESSGPVSDYQYSSDKTHAGYQERAYFTDYSENSVPKIIATVTQSPEVSYYDEKLGDISKPALKSSPRAINYDYSRPNYNGRDNYDAGDDRINFVSTTQDSVVATVGKIGLVMSQDDYEHYSTKVDLPKVVSSEILTYPQSNSADYATGAVANTSTHQTNPDTTLAQSINYDSPVSFDQVQDMDLIPSSSKNTDPSKDVEDVKMYDDYQGTMYDDEIKTTSPPQKFETENLWDTAPYTSNPSTTLTSTIRHNIQYSYNNVAVEKTLGVRVIDNLDRVSIQSSVQNEKLREIDPPRQNLEFRTEQPFTATPEKLTIVNNINLSTISTALPNIVSKNISSDVVNDANIRISQYLNPVPNFPTRPPYIQHTTKPPSNDAKTVPLVEVIMAGNRDYFSPSTSACRSTTFNHWSLSFTSIFVITVVIKMYSS